MEELQPGVEARGRSGSTGSRKYDVSGLTTCGADHVGAAQHGDPDVGAAAGEAAHVALDLGDVLGVARRGRAAAAPCPR